MTGWEEGQAVKTEHMIGFIIIAFLAWDVYLQYQMLGILKAEKSYG